MDTTSGTVFKRQAAQALSAKEEQKLDNLLERSNRIIFSTHTVFPFDFFPDEVTIDETKIQIIKKTFFYTQQTFPILIENIHNVTVSSSLFFASVKFEVAGSEENPGDLTFLWNSDAYKIKRIVTGITAAVKEGVDLSAIPTPELKQKLETIGARTDH